MTMRLPDILLLSASAAFVVIAVHQSMVFGFSQAYWAAMVALLLFFVFQYRQRK